MLLGPVLISYRAVLNPLNPRNPCNPRESRVGHSSIWTI